MNLEDKIAFLRDEKNINNRQLSSLSGIPYNTVRNFWIQGVENMRLSTFKTLCSFFGVTMDSMAWDDREIEYIKDRNPDSLSRKEQEMIEMYGKISEEGKQIVDSALKGAYEIAMEKKEEQDLSSGLAG